MFTLAYCEKGLPILYDEESLDVVYKGFKVPFLEIKDVFESGIDRTIINKIEYNRKNGFVTYDCLTLQEKQVKQLIQKTWKLSKMYNKVGN
jgi:hypothetical protein